MQAGRFTFGWSLMAAAWVAGLAGGVGARGAAAAAAEQISTQLEFRGISAREAFDKLSAALGERVVISRSVASEQLEQDVRLQVWHLTPEQAVRWIARLVDLEAIHTQEGFFVATAEQLQEMNVVPQGGQPQVISAAGQPPRPAVHTSSLGELLERGGPIFWHDTPLTRVSADVARVYGVDLIVHPRIAAEGVLLEWEHPKATLVQTCQHIADALRASIAYHDGALWVYRRAPATETRPAAAGSSDRRSAPPAPPASSEVAASPAEPSPPPPVVPTVTPAPGSRPASHPQSHAPVAPVAVPSRVAAPPAPALAGRLIVDESIRDWSSFARHLEAATGWTCQVQEAHRPYPPMSIDGSAAHVLEVLNLMGRIDYRLVRPDPAGGAVIELQIRPAR